MQRNFIIGDHWVYYKIYTGFKTSDRILVDIIRPAADYLIKENIIDRWYFIRYYDPEYHLRVRFHCINKEDYHNVISILHNFLDDELEKSTIWNIELSTYKRELERYGHNTIEESEEMFYLDSILVTDFIGIINKKNDEEKRWLFALVLIDNYLESFSYSLSDKLEFMKVLKEKFYREFNDSKLLRKQINEKYRGIKSKIFKFFENLSDEQGDQILNSILLTKKNKTLNVVTLILDLKIKNELIVSVNSLNISYIHMSMNRLFKSDNRKHELVCYDFLYNYYNTCYILSNLNL